MSLQNKMATSHVSRFILMHSYPRSKKWPTYHVDIPTGKALTSQQSIFRENRLIFDLYPPLRRLVLFVAWIITWKVRCWVTDTDTQTDTQTKYCNPRCACAPRLINHYHEIAIPNTQSPQHNWWNLVLPALHPAQWVTSIFVFSQEDIWLTDCLCQPTHEWSLSHIFRQKAGLHGHVDVIFQEKPIVWSKTIEPY